MDKDYTVVLMFSVFVFGFEDLDCFYCEGCGLELFYFSNSKKGLMYWKLNGSHPSLCFVHSTSVKLFAVPNCVLLIS